MTLRETSVQEQAPVNSLDRLRTLIEARQWDEAVAEYERQAGDGRAARLLLLGSQAYFGRRDLFSARRLAEAALAFWSPSEPVKLLGQIRFHLGMVAHHLGDTYMALQQFDLFLAELLRKYPDLCMGEGKAHFYRALTLRQRHDPEGAIVAYQRALYCFRRDGLPTLLCKGLQNLAWLLCAEGRPAEAAQCLAEAEPLISNPVDQVHQLLGEAFLAVVEGRYAAATSLCESIFRRAERGEPIGSEERAQSAQIAAKVALAQRNLPNAAALVDVAMSFAADAKDSRLINDTNRLRQDVANAMSPQS